MMRKEAVADAMASFSYLEDDTKFGVSFITVVSVKQYIMKKHILIRFKQPEKSNIIVCGAQL